MTYKAPFILHTQAHTYAYNTDRQIDTWLAPLERSYTVCVNVTNFSRTLHGKMLARKEGTVPGFTLAFSSNGFMEIINTELQVMTSTIQETIKFCDHNIRLRGRNANARKGT